MPQALPQQSLLSPNINKRVKHSVLKVSFGDGYEQRVKNGINATREYWTVSYVYMTKAQADVVRAALVAVGAWDYFTWTPYGDTVSKKFVVEPDSITEAFLDSRVMISFSMYQVFL